MNTDFKGWNGVIRKYAAYLPVTNATPIISLNEGNTPLVRVDGFVEAIGGEFELYLKYEGLNPTCSFKDRGMTLAIEPMVNVGRPAVKVLADGWTAVTKDGSLSAHFEHTVAVTKAGPLVLTRRSVPAQTA